MKLSEIKTAVNRRFKRLIGCFYDDPYWIVRYRIKSKGGIVCEETGQWPLNAPINDAHAAEVEALDYIKRTCMTTGTCEYTVKRAMWFELLHKYSPNVSGSPAIQTGD